MVSIPIVDKTGKTVGQYEVDTNEIADRISQQLLHDAVVMYQANQRQGSVKTKGRSDVAGSKKKMYRQKGTGNARAGHRRSNIRVGGGRSFAIDNPNWGYRMNKKALKMATRMALASKINDGEIVILDDFSVEAPKTREFTSVLKNVGLEGVTTFFAIPGYDINIYKSVRNVTGASVKPVLEMNALDILRPKSMLITRAALDAFRGKIAAEKGTDDNNEE